MPTTKTFISAFLAMVMFALPIAGALVWASQQGMLPELGLPPAVQQTGILIAIMMLPGAVVFLPVLPVILLYPRTTPWVYGSAYAAFGVVLGDGLLQSLALAVPIGAFGYLFARYEMNRCTGTFMELQR